MAGHFQCDHRHIQEPALRVLIVTRLMRNDLRRDTGDLNMNKSENKIRELTDTELNTVVGGSKQKPDGTAGGNVAAKWSLAQGAVA